MSSTTSPAQRRERQPRPVDNHRSINALAETLNGLYKAEVIHRRSWKNLEAVELATLKWVDWFNHRRLLEPIGNLPPAEAEANYHRQQAELREAA